uniref:Gypsy retrotransposon integrase-like protein 1 n=1 Tax=Salarias fasciatus TaxID=181472 RepID=A0A672INC6_SALFA
MVHDGHLGIVRVKQRCRGLVWWPGIDRDIEDLVRDCAACLTSGKTGPPPSPPRQPVPWPQTPWTHIQVDICGELHGTPHHQRFLLVAYDLHSKWPEVLPAGSVTTTGVIGFLSSLFARWGVPDAITTDNGPQFISTDFVAFMEGRGIKHIRTALYHPQANGGVERFNQTLKNGLRAHMADGLPFSDSLQSTLMHYRATPHSTTGSSPALLMLGRELQLPLERLRRPGSNVPAVATSTRGRVAEQQRRMKQRFDKEHRARHPALAVSDWVRVRRPTRSHKLLSFWSTPLQVAAQLGPATFRLADGSHWHASRLRRVAPPSLTDHLTPSDLVTTDGVWDPLHEPMEAPAGQPGELAGPSESARPEARPVRARQRPAYLRDYVTDF